LAEREPRLQGAFVDIISTDQLPQHTGDGLGCRRHLQEAPPRTVPTHVRHGRPATATGPHQYNPAADVFRKGKMDHVVALAEAGRTKVPASAAVKRAGDRSSDAVRARRYTRQRGLSAVWTSIRLVYSGRQPQVTSKADRVPSAMAFPLDQRFSHA
jgi:hypothetical protein